jgi:transposase InsO family protein
MKSKSEVSLLFKKFHKMVRRRYNSHVQVLHSDNEGEYLSSEFQQYLEAHRTIHQTTCSNTPQQNGVVERKKSLPIGDCSCFVDRSPYDVPIGEKHLPL